MPPKAASRATPDEDTIQAHVIQWARLQPLPAADDVEPGSVIADYLHAIPNGGARHMATARRLKATGVKAGVSDLLLPLPRQGKAGLWIELKTPRGQATPEQRAWIDRMRRAGYRAEIAKGRDAAIDLIRDYIGLGSTQ